MTDLLGRLLSERDWLLADGATGTALINMGLGRNEPAELWNLTHPDRVASHYQAAVDAGSDLFLTNSFGGNASRLRLHRLDAQVTALNRAAAEIGREVADRSDRPVVVAGSMGPIGEIMAPLGSLSQSRAVELFHQQAEALRDGGVDVLWVETISSLDEMKAAAEAARRVGLPWCGAMSFDTAGRTMMGVTPAQLAAAVERMTPPPLAFGANCGLGAADLLRSVAGLVAAGTERPLIAKGNAGVPHFHDGRVEYDAAPALMADYAVLARDMGVQIIGGCCGTMPAHLHAMRHALETVPPRPRPTPETIAARLGAFTTESDARR